jgi:parvulin-like peptidyl-prolyl isomerase
MALTINDEKVEEKRIEREMDRLRGHYEKVFPDKPKEEREKQLYDWSRENVIEMTLLVQEARRRDEAIPDEEMKKAWDDLAKQYQQRANKDINELSGEEREELKDNLKTQLRFDKLLKSITEHVEPPSEEEMKEFYEKNKENYRNPLQVKVSHIVKHPGAQTSPQQAEQIVRQAKEEIDNGEMFEMIVGKYSDCPDQGGSLGYIKPGQMVKEFEDKVFNMGPGEISDVFHTRFGSHIAKVYDRIESKIPSFEEVKDTIQQQLTEQKRSDAVNQFVDGLKETAEIKDSE